MRGRFIVFEGIDGAGKTTQIERLAERLRAEGRRVAVTAEPTTSVTGKMLREALAGRDLRTAAEMAALFVLDRINHNVGEGGIEQLLADGVDVICDRYYYSSLAYQGSQTDFEWVKAMNLNCPEIRRPDICIFLDLEPKESLRRIRSNRASDAIEIYETEEILGAVRDTFLAVLDTIGDKVAVIDAAHAIDEVADRVYAALS